MEVVKHYSSAAVLAISVIILGCGPWWLDHLDEVRIGTYNIRYQHCATETPDFWKDRMDAERKDDATLAG